MRSCRAGIDRPPGCRLPWVTRGRRQRPSPCSSAFSSGIGHVKYCGILVLLVAASEIAAAQTVPLPPPRPGIAGHAARRGGRTLRPAAAIGLLPAAHAEAGDCVRAVRSQRPGRLRRRGRGPARSHRARRQEPRRRHAARGGALRSGGGAGALGARRRGAGAAPAWAAAQHRQLRLLRMPRPQPRRRGEALRARQGQRARHALVQARQRQAHRTDQRARSPRICARA